MRCVVREGWQERGHRRRAEEGAGPSCEGSGTVIPILVGEVWVQKCRVVLSGRRVTREGLGP